MYWNSQLFEPRLKSFNFENDSGESRKLFYFFRKRRMTVWGNEVIFKQNIMISKRSLRHQIPYLCPSHLSFSKNIACLYSLFFFFFVCAPYASHFIERTKIELVKCVHFIIFFIQIFINFVWFYFLFSRH